MIYVLFSHKVEGYDFKVEVASENFDRVKRTAEEMGLDVSGLAPELNDLRGYGGNNDIKGWVDLGVKNSRQYLLQGKEIAAPDDGKLIGVFCNGDAMGWEASLLSLGNFDEAWRGFVIFLEDDCEETMDTVRELSMDYHKYGHAVDTSDCEYFRLDIDLDVS